MSQHIAKRRNPVLAKRERSSLPANRPARQPAPPATQADVVGLNWRMFAIVGLILSLAVFSTVSWVGAEITAAKLEGKLEAKDEIIETLRSTETAAPAMPQIDIPPVVAYGVLAVLVIVVAGAINPALGAVVALAITAGVLDSYGFIDLSGAFA